MLTCLNADSAEVKHLIPSQTPLFCFLYIQVGIGGARTIEIWPQCENSSCDTLGPILGRFWLH